MEIDKNEWKTLKKALDVWEQEGKLNREKTGELRRSFELKRTEAQQIAQYFFLVAISCIILAFGAIFIDEKFLEKFKSYFSLSNIVIAVLCGFLAGLWFWYIGKKLKDNSVIAYEVYMVLGGLLSITSLVYVCKDIGFGPSHGGFLFSTFLLLTCLASLFRSHALWIGGILALMGWFGAFSTWASYKNLFLGMNYPVRFAVFGGLIISLSILQLRMTSLRFSQRTTYLVGLLIFFTGLWGVSIFGNYGYLDEWAKVRQTQVLFYALLFAIVASLAFVIGIKYKDDTTRDFGILFLLLNLYSRYFEFFWDSMNKGIFFLVLAVSFWFIGRWIEKRKHFRKSRLKLPF